LISNLDKLTEPQEFITYYFNELKTELEANDLSLSKVGALGYLVHIMGNMQYDIKKYYDGLFKESFPISSTNNSNLQQHALTFGYKYNNAKAAYLNGLITFDFTGLPYVSENVYKRVITIDNDTSFMIDDINYIILSQHVISAVYNETNSKVSNETNYGVKIISENNELQVHSLNKLNQFTLNLVDCKQIIKEEKTYSIPSYPYGSYYSIEIELDDFVESLVVNVKEYNSLSVKEFKISPTKVFFDIMDEYVFYKIIYRNNTPILIIDLGSGKKGKYIPNSQVDIILYKTKGSRGNIGKSSIIQDLTGNVTVIDYDINDNVIFSISNVLPINQIISNITIINGYGGSDPLNGNELRKELVSFIQSRDNLISELDFENILSKKIKHLYFLFKKIQFQDNIMGLYIPILDRYLQPIFTISKNIDENDFLINKKIINDNIYIYYPEVKISDKLFISPFLYKKDNYLNVYKSFLVIDSLDFDINSINVVDIKFRSNPILIKLNLSFNATDNSTVFEIKTIITQESYTYKMRITDTEYVFDSTNKITIFNFLVDKFTAYVDVFDSDILIFTLTFFNVGLIEDTQDILHLKRYVSSDNSISLIDVPLVDKEVFIKDKTFYLTKLLSQLASISIPETRLISDDIQIKLINSYYIPKEYVKKITIQQYDFDIFLPLKINIKIIVENAYILVNNINIESAMVKLRLNIANYLNEKSGNNLKFYISKLIDFIHNDNEWIKSVEVNFKDSNGTILSNIETIDQKSFIQTLSRDEFLNFCPYLWWFDINDNRLIDNFTYIGD
jgi:hypothetical protein